MLKCDIKGSIDNFSLDVSFDVGDETAVFFGYSGSGKSLTLKSIAGLTNHHSGEITLNDKTLFSSKKKIDLKPQHRDIGYVFQDLALFPHMTVWKNVAYGYKGKNSKEKISEVEQMISLFNLQGMEHKYPHQISGGEKQRCAFARSLISKPKILLLDEPFSALDNPIRIGMRHCLKNSARKKFKIPVILVTHDIYEAFTMADKLYIFNEGKIIQRGTPKEILQNPATEDVKKLVNLQELFPELM